MQKDYITIKHDSRCELVEKKSKFIATIKKVYNVEDTIKILSEIKKEFKDASHHTYAYKIRSDSIYQKYSDDGEPKASAGLPILDAINYNNLENVIIVVTRYFGGTLLGVGGLVRSYSKVATMAIKQSGIVHMIKSKNISITCNYSLSGKIQNYLLENKINIIETKFLENVIINTLIPIDIVEKVIKDIVDLTSDNCKINIIKEQYMEMEN